MAARMEQIEDRGGTLIYRCRNCNKTFGPVGHTNAMDIAIESARDSKNLHAIHHCSDGNIGISDLVAVKPNDKEFHKRVAKLLR